MATATGLTERWPVFAERVQPTLRQVGIQREAVGRAGRRDYQRLRVDNAKPVVAPNPLFDRLEIIPHEPPRFFRDSVVELGGDPHVLDHSGRVGEHA